MARRYELFLRHSAQAPNHPISLVKSALVACVPSWNTLAVRAACISSLVFLACSGSGSGTADGGDGPGDDRDASPPISDAGSADAEAPSCTWHDLPRGITLVYGGQKRTVLLAGPQELPEAPLPLVINFHGYSDSPEEQEGFSQMSGDAVEQGFVVAYPRGTGLVKGWNAGACCGEAVTNDIDDVGFAEALIDAIAEVGCIDKERVYATGYSNGGFLSHRLACESSLFAGIAPVAGVMGMDSCDPVRAIPILHIHGTSDAVVPYSGNFALGFPSVEESMEGWSDRLSCSSAEPEVFFEQGDTTCVAWSDCDAPLGLCTIDGGGHTWPGGDNPIIRGRTSTDLDANAMLLEFLGVL